MPPAWVIGQAVPWQGPREAREDSATPLEAGGRRNGEVDAVGPGVRKPGDEPEARQ
jgi:hypothetical protein